MKLKNKKNAYLIGIKTSKETREEANENLLELHGLAKETNLNIIGFEIITIKKINTTYYIGSGKAEELAKIIKTKKINYLITDFELSPSQYRNLEKKIKTIIIDRKEIILNIFSIRAKNKEAILQIELAKTKLELPKLKRTWTHLSRQSGKSIGSRGEGEKQLEIDKRILNNKISNLKYQLKEIAKHRYIQRAKRENKDIPIGAIIGYTNAGKSSLLNLLSSNANIYVNNQLFSTLDPIAKVIKFSTKEKLILSDTVGFIRKLPHTLIEAFKSTLEEIKIADFLIHVIDISNKELKKYFETTKYILNELNIYDKPIITIFNKIDKISNKYELIQKLKNEYKNSIFISVKTNYGISNLYQKLIYYSSNDIKEFNFNIPIKKYNLLNNIYINGIITKIIYQENNILVTTKLSKKYVKELIQYKS